MKCVVEWCLRFKETRWTCVVGFGWLEISVCSFCAYKCTFYELHTQNAAEEEVSRKMKERVRSAMCMSTGALARSNVRIYSCCTFWLMNGVASTVYLLLHFFTKIFLRFICTTKSNNTHIHIVAIGVVISIRLIIYYRVFKVQIWSRDRHTNRYVVISRQKGRNYLNSSGSMDLVFTLFNLHLNFVCPCVPLCFVCFVGEFLTKKMMI